MSGILLVGTAAANGEIDSVRIVVDTEIAVGTFTDSPLGAFGYDPVHDRMLTAAANGQNLQLRLIENVSGSQTFTTQIFTTAWTKFTKAGDLNNGGGTPLPGSLLFNPKPIPSLGLGSFSNAWIMDSSGIVTQGSNPPEPHPELTKRVYRYNLLQDTNGDASDEFTTVMTLQQMQIAGSFTANTTNSGRQMAWSGDGQRLYFADSAPTSGGIYALTASGSEVKQLLKTGTTANSEPAVRTSGGVDTIYFRGTGTNAAGIDKITYDGNTASTRQMALSASVVNDFFEFPSGTPAISALSTDSEGNIYFTNSTSNSRPGIYKWDTDGRLIKVVSRIERETAFASRGPLIVTITRLQPRSTTFTNGTLTFPITQVLYSELPQSGLNTAVAGAFVFKAGDFNRDNVVNQDDMNDFKLHLSVKGVSASPENLKYDLNGNGEVSWKDVKILQQFYQFPDGDATIDRSVDIQDLWMLASHWQQTGQTWISGDFTGEGTVDAFDLKILANNWQSAVVGQSFDAALSATGLSNMIPEPSSAVYGFGCLAFLRRSRRARL